MAKSHACEQAKKERRLADLVVLLATNIHLRFAIPLQSDEGPWIETRWFLLGLYRPRNQTAMMAAIVASEKAEWLAAVSDVQMCAARDEYAVKDESSTVQIDVSSKQFAVRNQLAKC